ncbi:unnamed protein product, partial [Allacma fusca]
MSFRSNMKDRNRISKLRSRSSSVSKFLGPLKNVRSHFRYLYNRCTCHVDPGVPSNGFDSNSEPNVLDQMTITTDSLYSKRSCSTQNVPSKCDECHQVPERLKYTENQEFLQWYNCQAGISLVNGLLPSPPPTPLFHPDGDVLFHDKYSSRPGSNTLGALHQSGDAIRTRSGTSVNAGSDYEDLCQAMRPLSFSSYTRYTATTSTPSTAAWSQMDQPKFSTGLCLKEPIISPKSQDGLRPALFQKTKFASEIEQSPLLQEMSVTWKDLPKSISLNINSGFVESMFVPSWCNQVFRKAPFFVPISKVVNWSAIDVRNERVKSRRHKLLDLRKCHMEERKKIWSCRHRIGLMRRKLISDASSSSSSFGDPEGKGDISKKFQLIHWLSEKDTEMNTTGRYFDVEDKRLVAIKISPANPPPSVLERCKVKLEALKEIYALMKLEHVNIIGLFSYFESMEKIHLVLEACDHSLRSEISCAGGSVDPKLAFGVIYQIINGLDHCH